MAAVDRLELHGVVRGDRYAALARARDAVSEAGAWVTQVHLYSDMLACLVLDVPAAAGPRLADRLVAAELGLDAASRAALVSLSTLDRWDGPASLELTFAEGRGDLKHEVPAVPG